MSLTKLSLKKNKSKEIKKHIDYSLERKTTKNRLFLTAWIGLFLTLGDNLVYAFNDRLVQMDNVVISSVLSYIGCLAFPILAYGLIETYYYFKWKDKKKIKKYMIGLFIIALLSEVPFDLMKSGYFWNLNNQNIFITLATGFLLIILLDKDYAKFASLYKKKQKQRNIVNIIKFDFIFIFTIFTALLNFDYGGEGMLFIVLLNKAKKSKNRALWQLAAFAVFILIKFNFHYAICLICLAYIWLLELYLNNVEVENSKKIVLSKAMKIISSIFYPLQLIIIFVIKLVMTIYGY